MVVRDALTANSLKKSNNMENLKSHTGKFYEVTAKMAETQEDGATKDVKRTIAVEAESFGDAESKALEEFVGTDVDVTNINVAKYKEVFLSDNVNDENFYKAKLSFIVLDEKTEKEKRSNVVYLVQAKTLNTALKYIDDVMSRTMMDYESVGVVETGIEEFYLREQS